MELYKSEWFNAIIATRVSVADVPWIQIKIFLPYKDLVSLAKKTAKKEKSEKQKVPKMK